MLNSNNVKFVTKKPSLKIALRLIYTFWLWTNLSNFFTFILLHMRKLIEFLSFWRHVKDSFSQIVKAIYKRKEYSVRFLSGLALRHRSEGYNTVKKTNCKNLPYLRGQWGLVLMVLTFLLEPLVSYLRERVHLVISWLVFLQNDNTSYNIIVNIITFQYSI